MIRVILVAFGHSASVSSGSCFQNNAKCLLGSKTTSVSVSVSAFKTWRKWTGSTTASARHSTGFVCRETDSRLGSTYDDTDFLPAVCLEPLAWLRSCSVESIVSWDRFRAGCHDDVIRHLLCDLICEVKISSYAIPTDNLSFNSHWFQASAHTTVQEKLNSRRE